jgi:ATP-dependent DNA helicase RecQ
LERIHDLLSDRLPPGRAGCAIVFRATREATVGTAEFLQAKGWRAAYFHAGLIAPEKKRIQDEFLGGETQVICATNAFGMGIDKEDVRLVVHADTPGSLENYLQEAGRAGRDGQIAECVLLYDEEDCEQQFRLGAFSELSRRDIAQILRGLRKAAARGEEGKKNLGFKLSAAAKAAASFRALPVEVESIEQVKALVKAKELPGVGKASVERLQAWFETG